MPRHLAHLGVAWGADRRRLPASGARSAPPQLLHCRLESCGSELEPGKADEAKEATGSLLTAELSLATAAQARGKLQWGVRGGQVQLRE